MQFFLFVFAATPALWAPAEAYRRFHPYVSSLMGDPDSLGMNDGYPDKKTLGAPHFNRDSSFLQGEDEGETEEEGPMEAPKETEADTEGQGAASSDEVQETLDTQGEEETAEEREDPLSSSRTEAESSPESATTAITTTPPPPNEEPQETEGTARKPVKMAEGTEETPGWRKETSEGQEETADLLGVPKETRERPEETERKTAEKEQKSLRQDEPAGAPEERPSPEPQAGAPAEPVQEQTGDVGAPASPTKEEGPLTPEALAAREGAPITPTEEASGGTAEAPLKAEGKGAPVSPSVAAVAEQGALKAPPTSELGGPPEIEDAQGPVSIPEGAGATIPKEAAALVGAPTPGVVSPGVGGALGPPPSQLSRWTRQFLSTGRTTINLLARSDILKTFRERSREVRPSHQIINRLARQFQILRQQVAEARALEMLQGQQNENKETLNKETPITTITTERGALEPTETRP